MRQEVLNKIIDKVNSKKHIIIIAISVMSIIPVIYLSNFYIPARDDYSYAILVRKAVERGGGLIEVLKAALDTTLLYMKTWQGLYSSGFLLSLQPEAFGIEYGWIGPVMLMVVLYIGIYLLTRQINNLFKVNEKYLTLCLSTIVFVYIVHCLPDPTQAFFWFNGAANYTFFWAMGAINAAFLLRCFSDEKIRISDFFTILLSFIVSGGNHVSAFMNILVCFFFAAYSIVKKRKRSLVISTMAFVTACIGFYIVMSAPGTHVREAEYIRQSAINSIIWTAYRFFEESDEFITLSFILFMIILTPMLYKIARKLPEITISKLLISTVVWLIIVCGMTCVPYYAMGSWGASRLYDIIFYTWVIGAIIIYTMIIAFLGNKYGWQIIPEDIRLFLRNTVILIFTAVMLFITAFGNFDNHGTGARAVMEILSGEPQALRQEFLEREKMIGAGETVLPAYTSTNTMVFLADISRHQDHFSVSAFKEYHGMEEVYIIYPPEE